MIYTTFKQWAKGRFFASKDELALIETGWNYGYDAGVQWQKSQTALDKKAENARELGLDYAPQRKPLTRQQINQMMADAGWQNSAIRQANLDKVEKVARAIEAKLRSKNT